MLTTFYIADTFLSGRTSWPYPSVAADYGAPGPLSRRRIHTSLIRDHWDDICRVAGTLHTKAAVASEVIQALQRGGRPTALAQALAEVGRISRTIAILDYVTNPAQRRRILVQLNFRQETRHQLARDVFHGRRGHVYQPYRPGQEQQLGALGLVTNVLTLWKSRTWTTPWSTYGARGPTSPTRTRTSLAPLARAGQPPRPLCLLCSGSSPTRPPSPARHS